VPTTDSSAKSSPATSPERWFWLGALLVAALTLAAHARGLHGQFVEWDDTTHITQNPAIRALTLDNLRAMFTDYTAKLYIPLTLLSFALDYQLWGREPFGYHLTNLLLHLANTLWVLLFVRRLLNGRLAHAGWIALLTATIFGVHPLRVESVAWVTERKDVLFGFFYLLALLAYMRWAEQRRPGAYWLCFASFVAAVLSKSAAVTFPLVALLLDGFWARRQAWGEKLPFFIVSAIVGLSTISAQASGVGETVAGTAVIPVWARAGLVGYCALFYVAKFLWPVSLSAIYPTFEEFNWTLPVAASYLAALVVVCAAAFALRRRASLLWPAWLFYLVTLSPTIGLVPVGVHVVADRFSYVPLIGLALVTATGIAQVVERARLAGLVILAALGALALLAHQRSAVWADTETLFRSVLARQPDSYPALVNLTWWYAQHDRLDEAIRTGERALEVAPAGLPGRRHLAMALMKAGRHRDAVGVLRPAIDHGIVDDAGIWRALAECFTALGDETNAAVARRHLQRLAPAGN
jgi:hypothetical protein